MGAQSFSRMEAPNDRYSIEIATLHHDLEAIASLINAAFKKARFLKEGAIRTTRQEIVEEIASLDKRLYLCLSPTNVLCGTLLLEELAETQAKISLFTIHPNHQGSGLGRAFFEHVEKEAFKSARTIVLNVIPLFQESLVKYYEQLGYKIMGEPTPISEKLKSTHIREECRDLIFLITMQKDR